MKKSIFIFLFFLQILKRLIESYRFFELHCITSISLFQFFLRYHDVVLPYGIWVSFDARMKSLKYDNAFKNAVKDKCDNGLIATGHSLGGSMALLFAYFANKKEDPLGIFNFYVFFEQLLFDVFCPALDIGINVDRLYAFAPMPVHPKYVINQIKFFRLIFFIFIMITFFMHNQFLVHVYHNIYLVFILFFVLFLGHQKKRKHEKRCKRKW